jgi:hypothetical protein
MARFLLLASALAVAAGFQAPAVSKLAASRMAEPVRTAAVTMQEPGDKAVTVGAAAVGGVLGVYFFHELSTGVILASLFAYGSTLTNSFGSATKTAGSAAAKVYGKTLELNEQYDVLPKTKSALDTVTTAAANLDANYGITSSIDDKLQLSAAVDKASAKVDDIKSQLTSKVDDLKSKASTVED